MLAFLPGTVRLVGAVVVGAFGVAFSLAGLASLHRRTRGRPGRGLILFASYAAIFLLSFPLAVFTAIGLAETWRPPSRPAPTDRTDLTNLKPERNIPWTSFFSNASPGSARWATR